MDLVKIMSPDLRTGMYVSELDRPWLESSFLFQGFLLERDEQIAEVRDQCEFVFVDAEQSTIADSELRRLAAPEEDEGDATDAKAFRRAFRVRKEVKGYIDKALHDARLGESVDTKPAVRLVSSVTENVMRNANVMLWFTNLRALDEYTSIHCVNVCVLALAFGHGLGLSRDELHVLGLGALLHDLGKGRVPNEVLNKPGALDPEEWEEMKRHPVYGWEMLRHVQGLPKESLDIVHLHHERVNGTGYPFGLQSEAIDRMVRITSIVDVYDAVSSHRCYKRASSPHDTLKMMYTRAEHDFGKSLVESFIRCVGIYPVGSLVELTNGAVGIVTSVNPGRRLKPVVLLVTDPERHALRQRRFVNLAHRVGDSDLSIKRVLDEESCGIHVPDVVHEEAKSL